GGPGLQVRSDTEGAARTCDDDCADVVVPRRVLARARKLAQHPEVEGVERLRPVEGDRRARWRLLVQDRLEAELGGRARTRMRRLSQLRRTSRRTCRPSPLRPCQSP